MRAKSQRPRSKVAANNGKWRSWRRTKLKNTKKRKIIEKRIQCFCLLPRLVHSPTFSAPAHRKMATRNANLCSLLETSKRQQGRRTGGVATDDKSRLAGETLKTTPSVSSSLEKEWQEQRGREKGKEEKRVRERRKKGRRWKEEGRACRRVELDFCWLI